MANRRKRTPKNVETLLGTLAEGLSVTAACTAAGIGNSTYYEWRQDDPDFAALCDEAIERGTDRLEDVAKRRAEDQSDTLLIFLLKARRPGKYRERSSLELTGAEGKALTVLFAQRDDGPQ